MVAMTKFYDRKDLIIQYSEEYSSIAACDASGVSESAFYEWMAEGREDIKAGIESDKANFVESIKKARFKRDKPAMDSIANEIRAQNWLAAARHLEAMRPREYARNAHELRKADELDAKIDMLTDTIAAMMSHKTEKTD